MRARITFPAEIITEMGQSPTIPGNRRRAPLIITLIAFVVIVPVLALAAFVLVPLLFGHEYSAESPTQDGGTGADLVPLSTIQESLAESGFRCFEVAAEPTTAVSCHRTFDDGAIASVELFTNADGAVTAADVVGQPGPTFEHSRLTDAQRGDGPRAFTETYEQLGELLVGDEVTDMPSLEIDSDGRTLDWGTVAAEIHDGRGGNASFNHHDGVDRSSSPPGSIPDERTLNTELDALGYDCSSDGCEAAAPPTDATLSSNGRNLYVSIEDESGLDPTAAQTSLTEISTILLDDADVDEVDAWLGDTLHDGLGFSQADLAGFNFQLLYDDTRVNLQVRAWE